VFDDINFRFRPYDPLLAYGQSKTANVLFAIEATARWSEHGIYANALNPGAIPTNLQRHVGGTVKTPLELQKSPQQGASTSVLLAASPRLEGIGGRYLADCNEATLVDHRPEGFAEPATAVAPYALDRENARRLWDCHWRRFRNPTTGADVLTSFRSRASESWMQCLESVPRRGRSPAASTSPSSRQVVAARPAE
jgi:hypothetical protein